MLSAGGLGFFNALYNLQVAIADAMAPAASGDLGTALTDVLSGFNPADLMAF